MTAAEALRALMTRVDQLEERIAALESAGGEWAEEFDPETIQVADLISSGFDHTRGFDPNVDHTGAAGEEVEPPFDPRNIPAPTDQQRQLRQQLSRRMELDAYAASVPEWPDHPLDQAGNRTGEMWADVYVRGGPLWLYHTDREAVMSMPPDIRQRMLEDAIITNADAAHEMGRDILKQPGEIGPGGPAMAVGDSNMTRDD